MNNASNFNLDEMTASWAVEIFEKAQDLDEALHLAHQYADGSEGVIYYGKAHQLCQKCNTELGEEYLEDIGQTCEGMTYDKWASAIAYGEIYTRLGRDVQDLFEMAEKANQTYTGLLC